MAGAACLMTRAAQACGLSDDVKPLIHLSDFVMGIAASSAYGLLLRRAKPIAGAWIYLPAGALAAGMVALPRCLPPGLDLNTAMRPCNAAVLVGLGLGGGAVARLLSLRPVVYLGKASYSLYILHVPVLWWYCRYARFSAPVYVVGVVAISALVYGFIEEPANGYLRRTFGGKRATRP
jgi:peptidoglycan/LPS O-acetylase OafA/YrhL